MHHHLSRLGAIIRIAQTLFEPLPISLDPTLIENPKGWEGPYTMSFWKAYMVCSSFFPFLVLQRLPRNPRISQAIAPVTQVVLESFACSLLPLNRSPSWLSFLHSLPFARAAKNPHQNSGRPRKHTGTPSSLVLLLLCLSQYPSHAYCGTSWVNHA
jgi:hypothetical protein